MAARNAASTARGRVNPDVGTTTAAKMNATEREASGKARNVHAREARLAARQRKSRRPVHPLSMTTSGWRSPRPPSSPRLPSLPEAQLSPQLETSTTSL